MKPSTKKTTLYLRIFMNPCVQRDNTRNRWHRHRCRRRIRMPPAGPRRATARAPAQPRPRGAMQPAWRHDNPPGRRWQHGVQTHDMGESRPPGWKGSMVACSAPGTRQPPGRCPDVPKHQGLTDRDPGPPGQALLTRARRRPVSTGSRGGRASRPRRPGSARTGGGSGIHGPPVNSKPTRRPHDSSRKP